MHSKELQGLISPAFTDETLYEIVKRKTNWTDVCIKNIIIDRNKAEKGNSYASFITKFTIEADGKVALSANDKKVLEINDSVLENHISLSVLVKALPKSAARIKSFRLDEFFSNEINFFTIVWEPLRQFAKAKNLNIGLENILPVYLSSLNDPVIGFIALEDETPNGFKAATRSEGLDYEHSISILKTFAQFHGLSYAYKIQHPDEFELITSALQEIYFHERIRSRFLQYQKNLINCVRDSIQRHLPELYLKTFDDLTQEKDFFGLLCQLCSVETPLTVICHRDIWVPNFLLKYGGNNKVEQVKIIDFQLVQKGSLGLDISSFIYSCVEETIRDQHFDEFIQIYHKTFQEVLNDLGSDGSLITYQEIYDEIKKFGQFGIGMTIEAVINSLLDEENVADIDDIEGDGPVPLHEILKVQPFKCEKKQKRIASFIKHAVDQGFI